MCRRFDGQPRVAGDDGSQLEQPDAWRVDLRAGQFGTWQRQCTQPLHEQVGQCCQQHPQPVGREVVAGRAGGEQADLRFLDVVLGFAALLAEVASIPWSRDGWSLHSTTVAPGKFAALCGKLPAGLQVRWQFEAGAQLNFNVHCHLGNEAMFPFKLSAVASTRDTLDTRIGQDYC